MPPSRLPPTPAETAMPCLLSLTAFSIKSLAAAASAPVAPEISSPIVRYCPVTLLRETLFSSATGNGPWYDPWRRCRCVFSANCIPTGAPGMDNSAVFAATCAASLIFPITLGAVAFPPSMSENRSNTCEGETVLIPSCDLPKFGSIPALRTASAITDEHVLPNFAKAE